MSVAYCIAKSASIVMETVLCALFGVFVWKRITSPKQSTEGIAAISLTVFLPSLTFVTITRQAKWGNITAFLWMFVFACLSKTMTLLLATFTRSLCPAQWHGAILLSSILQSSLTFGITAPFLLRGLSLDTSMVTENVLAYVLFYSAVSFLISWVIGELVVKPFMEERHHESLMSSRLELVHYGTQIMQREESVNESEVPVTDSVKTRHGSNSDNHTEQEAQNQPHPSRSSRCSDALGVIAAVSKRPIIVIAFVSVIIGITPPLQWILVSPLGVMVVGGMKLIAYGSVPLQLFLYGVELFAAQEMAGTTRTARTGVEERERDSDSAPGRDGEATSAGQNNCGAKRGTLVMCSLLAFNVHFLVPMVCFAFILLLRSHNLLPSDINFLLAALIGTCAPSTVDPFLVYNANEIMSATYSKILPFMDASAIVATIVWFSVYFLYLGG
uniref:Putative transporter n=1 Tax=Trypanosoma congolense (strain IL3000) TaxID=1068625 RepID=G0UYS7_TRYCI|nr:putative transporter [Trypanosoma congolense IL3000]